MACQREGVSNLINKPERKMNDRLVCTISSIQVQVVLKMRVVKHSLWGTWSFERLEKKHFPLLHRSSMICNLEDVARLQGL